MMVIMIMITKMMTVIMKMKNDNKNDDGYNDNESDNDDGDNQSTRKVSPGWRRASVVFRSRPATTIIIITTTIIIIISRPKPAYGQQGLVGGSLRASGAQLRSGK